MVIHKFTSVASMSFLQIIAPEVEITSPGKLLPSIDYTELEARLKAYPEIEFKWFEKGLQFQVQFIKKEFTPNPGADPINLDPEAIERKFGPRAIKILTLISEDNQITIEKIAEETNASKSTVNRDIKNLTDEGLISRTGSKNLDSG